MGSLKKSPSPKPSEPFGFVASPRSRLSFAVSCSCVVAATAPLFLARLSVSPIPSASLLHQPAQWATPNQGSSECSTRYGPTRSRVPRWISRCVFVWRDDRLCAVSPNQPMRLNASERNDWLRWSAPSERGRRQQHDDHEAQTSGSYQPRSNPPRPTILTPTRFCRLFGRRATTLEMTALDIWPMPFEPTPLSRSSISRYIYARCRLSCHVSLVDSMGMICTEQRHWRRGPQCSQAGSRVQPIHRQTHRRSTSHSSVSAEQEAVVLTHDNMIAPATRTTRSKATRRLRRGCCNR